MNVDAIYVISLTTATKRREIMKNWYPPEANLEFFIVQRSKNPSQGCFESHQKVYELARNKGYTRVLVMEDDAFPRFSWNEIVQKTNEVLLNLEDKKWDFLALGYYPLKMIKTDKNNILEIKSAYGTHAYIANIPNVKYHMWNNILADQFLFFKRKSPYISYATYDILFEQQTDESQINKLSAYSYATDTNSGLPKVFGGLEHMRDVSTNCHIGILTGIIILFPLLFITTLLVWSAGSKKVGTIYTGVVIFIMILSLFLLFLL